MKKRIAIAIAMLFIAIVQACAQNTNTSAKARVIRNKPSNYLDSTFVVKPRTGSSNPGNKTSNGNKPPKTKIREDSILIKRPVRRN